MKELDQVISAVSAAIRFPSVQGEATEKYPFGKDVYDCLQYYLSLAEGMGFETHDYDGYIGEVVFGEGEEFAVLAHLDVVPAGDGWTRDPFGGEVENGRIWGRGAVDDKGPAIACLFALKALKERGFQPKKKIKLIVGCNEENGWGCINHYRKVAAMPKIGFSPDADFPVVYAEKGIMQAEFTYRAEGKLPFLTIEGGKAHNMVCDLCKAELSKEEAQKRNLPALLTTRGKCAHASTPDEGENAILAMLELFDDNEDVKRILDCLFYDVFALKSIEDETGKLTLSPNTIRLEGGVLRIVCDIRCPASVPLDRLEERFAPFGMEYKVLHAQKAHHVPKESELVQTLLKVYEAHTGTTAEPAAIGGGTYARALEYGVAFGPEMKGDEAVVHQANEYITIERLALLLDIYEDAIERLTE